MSLRQADSVSKSMLPRRRYAIPSRLRRRPILNTTKPKGFRRRCTSVLGDLRHNAAVHFPGVSSQQTQEIFSILRTIRLTQTGEAVG